jgi:methylmalonyl-CoA mutase N-terminal domain/subunit
VPYEAPGVTVCRACLAAMLAALDRAPELLANPYTEDETP